MGFSCSKNVNKEIVISAMADFMQKASASLLAGCFFVIKSVHHRMALMSEKKRSGFELQSHRRYKVVIVDKDNCKNLL